MTDSRYEYLVNEIDDKNHHSIVLIVRGWLPSKQQLIGWNMEDKYTSQEDIWEEMKTLELKAYDRINPYNGLIYTMPRLNYAMSDESLEGRAYGNVQILFNKWAQGCLDLRDRIFKESSIWFNSSLINAYRNESDMIDFHPDRESLGKGSAVVTVSVGDTRRFELKRNSDGKEYTTYLHSGDLVLMYGDTQKTHKHAIPREKIKRGMRYSVTYRLMSSTQIGSF